MEDMKQSHPQEVVLCMHCCQEGELVPTGHLTCPQWSHTSSPSSPMKTRANVREARSMEHAQKQISRARRHPAISGKGVLQERI